MLWQTVKHSKDVVLQGISIEIDKVNSSFSLVTLTDAAGNKLRIRQESYNMQVEVPAKPEKEKKWAVRGEFKGLQVDETFDGKYEAESRRDDLDSSLTVEETEVEIPF